MRNLILRPSSWLFLIPSLVLMGASAQAAMFLCTGPETTTYSPGLTDTPRTVDFAANSTLTACPVALFSGNILPKKISNVGRYVASCALDNPGAPVSTRIEWSDGSLGITQGQTISNTKTNGQLVILLNEKIISGHFKGQSIIRTITSVQLNPLACQSPEGVTQVDGLSTFVMLGN
ncbi:MAG: hypothetical protein EOO71_10635 [Myxococcaceae bacterium]|nr:MAG: hypothetical protein EOO71_10635 [Myxococcaceae bacterium]